MATYYVHLGFDWSSYLISSVWGSSDQTTYWLQYAVTTNASGPTWDPALFLFQPNDSLFFRVWCLSPLSKLSSYEVTGVIALNAIEPDQTTGSVTKYTSTSGLVDLSDSKSLAWGTDGDVLDLSANLAISSDPSPWGRSAGYSTNQIGPMTLLNPSDPSAAFYFKMNFQLTVAGASDSKVFISDPETRVGSGET